MCPEATERGDVISVLLGGSMPLMLRPAGGQFRLVGECYVHGIMRGEAMGDCEKGSHEIRDFELR
jgi:hypothetical protein